MPPNDFSSNGTTGVRSVFSLSTVRALRSRNFKLFFGGQSISLIGVWMTRIATVWLVYRLTQSEWLLGIVGFTSQIPMFLAAPFAGVLVDRWNRHRIMVATAVLAMSQSLLLAFLTLTDRITIAQIIVVSLIQGLINAFDTPTRQSMMIEMVENRADMANAIAMNSLMVNAARLVGPSIAGVVIAASNEGVCFLLDGVSYIPVILALLAMRFRPRVPSSERLRIWRELKEGIKYVGGFIPIRNLLIQLAVVSVASMPYGVLLPVIARELLGGNSRTFGFLMAGSGLGALIGAVYLASRQTVLGLGRMLPLAGSLFGACLVAIAFSHHFWVSLVLMLFSGFGVMVQLAGSNTLLQTLSDDDKRGRVMSFYTLAFMGMTAVGNLLAGWVASRIGAPWTFVLSGLAAMGAAAWFTSRLKDMHEQARPIYVKLGILNGGVNP